MKRLRGARARALAFLVSRGPGDAAGTAELRYRSPGKNKIDEALTSAAMRLKLDLKRDGKLPGKAMTEIASRIGVTVKTLHNWRRAGRVVTNDIEHAFALEDLSGIPARYLASRRR
jgi:hypothetical protein